MKAVKTFVYHFYEKFDEKSTKEGKKVLSSRGTFSAIREKFSKPVATVALIQDNLGMWHRGVAICNPNDTFNKIVGCNKAIGWATSAMVNGSCVNELKDKLSEACPGWPPPLSHMVLPHVFRSKRQKLYFSGTYGATMTAYEQELVTERPETAKVKAKAKARTKARTKA